MTHEQRGIFIDMLAIAWDSEEPGTIFLSERALCRELGIFKRTLRRLLADFPATWRREEGKLVQPKLHEQWLKYQDIQQKRSASAQQMHMQKGGSAFAFASASATAPAVKEQTPLVPEENAFQTFWKAYPKKVNEKAAFREWVHCTGIHNHLEEILTVIMRYETSGMWDDPTKIPNAENFIRDRRWRDEVPQRGGTKNDQRISRTLEAAKRVMESGPQVGDAFSGTLSSGPVGAGDKNLLRISRK